MSQIDYDLSWVNQPATPQSTPMPSGEPMPDMSWARESGSYSLGEYGQQAWSSLATGFTDTFTGAVEGLGLAVEKMTGESEIDDWARETANEIRQAVPGVTGLEDSWTAKISGAFGSAGGFITGSVAASAAGAAIGTLIEPGGGTVAGAVGGAVAGGLRAGTMAASFARAAGLMSAGTLGALGQGAARYDEAKARGVSEEDAWKSYYVGLGIGSLEAMPIGLNRAAQRLAKINSASKGAAWKLTVGQVMLHEGFEEAGQEMLSESLNELSDYALGIKTQEEAFDLQRILESGVLGFLPGSVIGGLTAKGHIAAQNAEEARLAAEEEAKRLPEELAKQREEMAAAKMENLTAEVKMADEAVAAGEAELARLEGRTPTETVAPADTETAMPTEAAAAASASTAATPTAAPVPIGTPEQIAAVRTQLEALQKNRSALAEQLRAATAETTVEGREQQVGAYGYARARAAQEGRLAEFEASQKGGAVRTLTREQQSEWDDTKARWGKFAGFKEEYKGFKDAQLVVPSTTGQQNAERLLNALGFEVEFVEPGADGSWQGTQQGKKVYLNARMSDDALLKRVARHEAFHGIYKAKEAEWKDTFANLAQAAPNVFAAAMQKARAELAGTYGIEGDKLQKFLSSEEGRKALADETMSSSVDIFSATIDALEENPALAEEVIQADPTFFQKIYDWVKEKLNKIGFSFETLADKDRAAVAKLPKLLYQTEAGDVEVQAGANERIAGAQVLIRLLRAAEMGTVAAASSRERQARMFATQTLGELEARGVIEARESALLDQQIEKKRQEYEAKRKRQVEQFRGRIRRINPSDEEWKIIEAAGLATDVEGQLEAVRRLPDLPPMAMEEDYRSLAQAAVERYDQERQRKEQVAEREAAKVQRQTEAADRLAQRKTEAETRRRAKAAEKINDLRSEYPTGTAQGVINRTILVDGNPAEVERAVKSYLGNKATEAEIADAMAAAQEAALAQVQEREEKAKKAEAAAQKRKDEKAAAVERAAAQRAAAKAERQQQAQIRSQERAEAARKREEAAQQRNVERLQAIAEQTAAIKASAAQREAAMAELRQIREQQLAVAKERVAELGRLREQRENQAKAAKEEKLQALRQKQAETAKQQEEAAKKAEAQAQAELAKEQAKERRRAEKLPTVVRGKIVPGQLRVGDIVNYKNSAAKVVGATGSGSDQKVKLRVITRSEEELARKLEKEGTKDWWNAIPWADPNEVAVPMTDPGLRSLIAKRSDAEVLTEDGKRMLQRRLEADIARKEGEEPRFSSDFSFRRPKGDSVQAWESIAYRLNDQLESWDELFEDQEQANRALPLRYAISAAVNQIQFNLKVDAPIGNFDDDTAKWILDELDLLQEVADDGERKALKYIEKRLRDQLAASRGELTKKPTRTPATGSVLYKWSKSPERATKELGGDSVRGLLQFALNLPDTDNAPDRYQYQELKAIMAEILATNSPRLDQPVRLAKGREHSTYGSGVKLKTTRVKESALTVVHEVAHNISQNAIDSANLGREDIKGQAYLDRVKAATNAANIAPNFAADGAAEGVSQIADAFLQAWSQYESIWDKANPDLAGRAKDRVAGGNPDRALKSAGRFNYYMSNMDEFVAGAMSDKEFQLWLNSIPAKQESGTLWTKFIEAVTKILGLDVDRASVLAQVLEGTERVAEAEAAWAAKAQKSPTRFSRVTPKMDADYMAAVERGDRALTQQMVDKAAALAGFNETGSHGLSSGKLEGRFFDPNRLGSNTNAGSAKLGFFFASPQTARTYGQKSFRDDGFDVTSIAQGIIEPILKAIPKGVSQDLDWVRDLRDSAFVPSQYDEMNPEDFADSTNDYLKRVLNSAEWDVSQLDSPLENQDQIAILLSKANEKRVKLLEEVDSYDFVNVAVENVRLKMQRPYVYDQKGLQYREESYYSIISEAKDRGYDSVIIKNTYDGGPLDDVKVVFEPNQIKSADAVSYDETGQVIPLSKRFDPSTTDIYFSRVSSAVGFAGGGTFHLALPELDVQLAVEKDPAVAQAHDLNSRRPVSVARLGDVTPEEFMGKTLAQFSPPCVDSSLLRSGEAIDRATETALGKQVADIIRTAKNPIVIIENVKDYLKTEAFAEIAKALDEVGYKWDANVYRAQDYGSATKRQRMIVRAVREGELPAKPEPTHAATPSATRAAYVGWGETIGDMVDSLPEMPGELPAYVLRTLDKMGIDPKSPKKAYYISGTQTYGVVPISSYENPAPVVVASDAAVSRILMPDGRVLRVTPEAMKRLMGFGSEMALPADAKMAQRVVGNGIPKQLTRAVVMPVLQSQGVLEDIRFSTKGKPAKETKAQPKRVSAKTARAATVAAKKANQALIKAQQQALKEVKGLYTTALKEGEETKVGERPATAIAAETEEGRAFTRALREYLDGFREQIMPDIKTDDDARQYALDALSKDYEGTKQSLYKEIRENGSVTDAWKQYAVMAIAAREAEVATTGRITREKFLAAYEAEGYDAIVKRQASAQLRVRRDAKNSARSRNRSAVFAETKTLRKLQSQLTKATRSGKKADVAKLEKQIEKVRQRHVDAVVDFLEDMQKQGYDVEDMFSYIASGDPVTFSRFVRGMADARTTSDIRAGALDAAWDIVMQARMVSMLSGPLTHSANITGNAAMMTLRTTRALAEVLTNLVVRDKNSADWGDFKAYMTGWLRSLGKAMRNLVMAYRTDMPVFEVELNAEAASEFAENVTGIPGIIGRMLRLPSLTTLRAFDEFFKTMATYTEVASLAYRDGRSNGLSGDALETHIDSVLSNYNHPLWMEGLDKALVTVFQDKSDKLTQILLSARSYLDNNPTTIPVGSYLLPFVKTPVQIFKVGLGMPIHPIMPLMRFARAKIKGGEYTAQQFVPDGANAMVAVGMMVLAYSLLGDDDDDEERVTGAAPDKWEERVLKERVAPANSIRSSDGTWYSYARVEPFATAFSLMVDGIKAQQRVMRDDVPDKWSQAFEIMLNNAVGQFEDKTFLRTVGDVAKLFRERDQVNAAKFARDLFITPMIPNLVRQPVGATDPYIRETGVREYEDKSSWESMMQSVDYQLWPSGDRPDAPPMRYDLWGRPLKRGGDSAFARAFSPAQERWDEDNTHKLDRLIVNFNDKVADGKFSGDVQKYLPRAAEYRITRSGVDYILTDAEYARVSKEAGERAARLLNYRRLDYDDPTERDINAIKETLSKSRKIVIDRVLRERRAAQPSGS